MNLLPRTAIALFACFIFPTCAFAQNKEPWPDVTPAEVQMTVPKVDPHADAEVLNWEVRIDDEYFRTIGYRTTLNHFLRIKVFTERGREKHSKFEIPFGKIEDFGVNVIVKDIAARTITADGRVHEVKQSDIFDQDSVKANGVRLKVKSFAMPGIAQGAIVEYRWKEIRSNSVSNYVRIEYSRDIPVQRVKYSVRPVSFPRGALAMRIHSANITSNFVKEKDDFYSITMTSIPALRPEPRMRAPFEIQPWSLIYYADPDVDTQGADKYWAAKARQNHESHTKMLKFDDSVRQAAQQAIAGATDQDEKVKRIFEFCRRNIKDVADDAGANVDRRDSSPNASSSDVLKKRSGTWHDIGMLFGAMLNSIGMDARVANVTLKTDPAFDKSQPNDYFIRTEIMAVKAGSSWKFFDFSNRHLPYGMLPASVEGQTAMISAKENPEWTLTPSSPAGSSTIRRTADLQVMGDGTIEGSVRLSFSGHPGGTYKELIDDDSMASREKWLTEMVKREIHSLAEVKSISFQGTENSEEPLLIEFKIRVPSYAEVTGRRLFVRPNIFKRNEVSEFSSSFRQYDISFDHRWTEADELTIRLPQDFGIESADEPEPIMDDGISISNRISISTSPETKAVSFNRIMVFEAKNGLVFDSTAYPRIKNVFDAISKANEHTLALRQN